jgi:hypothetical protein
MRSTIHFILVLFVSLLLTNDCSGQEKKETAIVQFSGVVVSADSVAPIPFTSVIIKNSGRGTISDYYGYFSFVALANDTIEFHSLGYKKSSFIIPNDLTENRYSLIQMLHNDTIYLRESVIYPWPTKEQFKQAFLNLNIPDDDLERAKKNIAREEIKERYDNMPMDASMNQRYYAQQFNSRLYYAGQLPPNNLLNPIAWAKFIQAWKNGDFKRKD